MSSRPWTLFILLTYGGDFQRPCRIVFTDNYTNILIKEIENREYPPAVFYSATEAQEAINRAKESPLKILIARYERTM